MTMSDYEACRDAEVPSCEQCDRTLERGLSFCSFCWNSIGGKLQAALLQIDALKSEARGATDAHREAVASNDRMIRERDDALRLIESMKKVIAESHADCPCAVCLLESRLTEKRAVSPPKKGEFPDRSVNGCKCPCHAEIAEDGVGYPCGEDECRPCHVKPPKFRG
jgi:hypothetical protein